MKNQTFSFCVSIPTVLSLDVDSILCPKSSGLSWIIVLLLVAQLITYDHPTGYPSYTSFSWFFSFLSVSILEVVPVHMEFLQFIIPFSTIVFHHQQIPQFVQPFPNWRAYPCFPVFCHYKERSWKYFCTSFSLWSLWGTNPTMVWLNQRAGNFFSSLCA